MGASIAELPADQLAPEEGSQSEAPLENTRKRRRAKKAACSATSVARVADQTDASGQILSEAANISSDRTPSAPLAASPAASLPPLSAQGRILRSSINPVPSSSRTGRSASSHSATTRRRHVITTLHLPTEDLSALGSSADQTEHRIIIRGHLVEIWEDARARAAAAPPSFWVDGLAMSQRLAFVEDELKRLKETPGQLGATHGLNDTQVAQLQADLAKSEELLAAERGKSAEQVGHIDRIKREISTFEGKITLATNRKQRAIKDLEKKNVEARALEQKLKQTEDKLKNVEGLLMSERQARESEETTLRSQLSDKDADLAVVKADLESIQSALEAYKESEPSRFEEMKVAYIRSDTFVDKFVARVLRLFGCTVDNIFDQLKKKGHLPANLPGSTIDRDQLNDSIPDDTLAYLE
ncbi:uncharacterized protein LOC122043899 [Zingiber officinale]|uniref:uncharacterized protein LOC122043899 n=1 Tax=Zingiber officinale TaxID=94328 RepID=UPI001C4B8B6C|nr:uncharacterized protein LOC122043899 [Zingiber officinale]